MKKNMVLSGVAIVFILTVWLVYLGYDRVVLYFAAPSNIVAEVNGEAVTLEEVEAIYDMRNIHLNKPAPDLAAVQQEYGKIVFDRIKQILVSQELKKLRVQVSDQEVDDLEKSVQDSYAEVLNDSMDFKDYLLENGIEYEEWRKQLLYQLENKKLQELLLKGVILSSEDTLNTAKLHEQEEEKEKIQFFMLRASAELLKEIRKDTAFSAESVQENGFLAEDFINYYEEKGAIVLQALFESDGLPEEYKNILADMKSHTFSEIHEEENNSYILYLQSRAKPEKGDAVDLYFQAEEHALREKLPEVYDAWLAKAVEEAEIRIINSFNPEKQVREVDANNINKLQNMLKEMEN